MWSNEIPSIYMIKFAYKIKFICKTPHICHLNTMRMRSYGVCA